MGDVCNELHLAPAGTEETGVVVSEKVGGKAADLAVPRASV
jgi:hypothetical protein